jgi:hypothetical protein
VGNRTHERRPVSVPIVLAIENAPSGLEAVQGELIDISEGGAGVVLQMPESAREGLLNNASQITLLRPEQSKVGRLPVEAVWVNVPEPDTLRSGFRFIDEPGLSQRVNELLNAFPNRSKPLFQ